MRCFNSQTRSAASKSALVRVRVPAAASSRSGWACPAEVAVPERGRPRLWVFDLRPRRLLDALTERLPLLIINKCNHNYSISNLWTTLLHVLYPPCLFEANRGRG